MPPNTLAPGVPLSLQQKIQFVVACATAGASPDDLVEAITEQQLAAEHVAAVVDGLESAADRLRRAQRQLAGDTADDEDE